MTDKNKRFWKFSGVAVLCILSLFCAFSTGAYLSQNSNSFGELVQKEVDYFGIDKLNSASAVTANIDYNLYWKVWNTIKEEYVNKDQLSDQDLFYGGLKGMVAATGDPYTVFMTPKENKQFEDDMAGTFEGIGAEIGLRDEIITIISPLNDMPAAKAGLKAGDQVFAINGTSTANMTVDEAVRQIRGPKDTKVTLTIFRTGEKNTKDYTITRGVIVVKSVKTEMRADGLYVISVSAFNNDTWGLFQNAVDDVVAKKPKGIILDLRNNPGGYLDTAVDMSSEWVKEGPVVIEKFSDTKQNKYLSTGSARLKDIPTVVLINKGSASASEIVAGALQDTKQATIVGEKSFGKGSVQSLVNLDDGSSIKITIAKWLTPKGISINDQGITPDQEVIIKATDATKEVDPQMQRSLDILNKKTVLK
ncbi:S41 family peptidase [Candidatus Falkowbacteria bacterium CG10_big_fil_rev_8_21_14_0_10_39_9]|uniref:S41 family peptidase n=1 Tax=Candidatus Falkowbacteria bacterium CG10_big_fil_rev_8_21_14_0_10_39_9 TaxID=1974566 RepID=A0A2M6WPR7_9BACT|nr:MAG: S41 family peptidase [Candidatus Falkowbacteria bacterium CG10_big_fil_rev_8_21_14_0_10_39_9]